MLAHQPIDGYLTHDARPDFVLINPGVKIKRSVTGPSTIGDLLDSYRPAYHFFGHYGGGPQVRIDANGSTQSVKLADLHWKPGNQVLESGAMGILRWQNQEEHSFTVLYDLWLKEYTMQTWRYL